MRFFRVVILIIFIIIVSSALFIFLKPSISIFNARPSPVPSGLPALHFFWQEQWWTWQSEAGIQVLAKPYEGLPIRLSNSYDWSNETSLFPLLNHLRDAGLTWQPAAVSIEGKMPSEFRVNLIDGRQVIFDLDNIESLERQTRTLQAFLSKPTIQTPHTEIDVRYVDLIVR